VTSGPDDGTDRGVFVSLITAIDGVPVHFVLNMDEMGHQDWADRQVQTCYVQTDHIAKVVCTSMSAAMPVNVAKTFKRAGIGVVVDDGVLRCGVCPDMR
jgi:hypothetical protein